MTKLQTVSAALFAISLMAVPVLVWTVVMYHTLEATGAMVAALA